MKRFRHEEQTALWNKGLGEEDIVRGLMEATGHDETAVTTWLVESSVERPIGRAVDLWAATRWHKEFPRYYAVVGRHMEAAHTAMCALNNVSSRLMATFEEKLRVVERPSGGIYVLEMLQGEWSPSERYDDQAAFATAYILQQG